MGIAIMLVALSVMWPARPWRKEMAEKNLPPLPVAGAITYEFPDGAYDSESMLEYGRACYEAALASAPVAGEQMREALQKSFDMGKFYGSLPENDDKCPVAGEAQRPVAWMLVGRLRNSDPKFTLADPAGIYESVYAPLYAAPQASAEPVSDAGTAASDDVVLPPLPFPAPRHIRAAQMKEYARAAVLADRQQRAGDVTLPPLPAPPAWTITGAEQRNQLCEWATEYARAALAKARGQQREEE